ncbi:sensor histidine kinase [Rothia halotolerans]|uniref:sensor histidine kinase n=1 Tax=Rothia halotolerans TaxID=405770 RepID=UPI00101C978F|nr:histidine kinase [Rothia halotolerans]
MQHFERPVWASWAWPIAFAALALLFVLLPGLPIGRIEPIWSLAGFALLVVGVVGWAVLRTRLQRRQYEARLEEWAKAKASQDERLRIARELHDLASHGLGTMTVRAATAKLADEDERLMALADIERLGRRSTAELRKMLAVLRDPGAQAPMRPADSLADLPEIIETARRTGIEVEASMDELGEVPASVQVTICAVVREALANAARHAGATRSQVSIVLTRRGIAVDVRDTGPSPGWQPHPGTGHGIDGLRERVGLHGGTLTTGEHEGGFRVLAELPREEQ